MKASIPFGAALTVWLMFFSITALHADDVRLRISQTSINLVFEAMLKSKLLSYGKFTGDHQFIDITYYSLKPKELTLNLQPGKVFTLTMKADAAANFKFGDFEFGKTSLNQTITISGVVSLVQVGTSYKIRFTPQSFIYNNNNWLKEVLNLIGSGLLYMLPEISTSSELPLLPAAATQYFTSSVPTLSTTTNEIILSYTLQTGPRYVSVFNEVAGQSNIGSIQEVVGGSLFNYFSPKTFEWNIGSVRQVQTPQILLDDVQGGKHKYRNFFKDSGTNPFAEIAPRRIQFTVGTQDATYRARFDQARRIQLYNILEGNLSGGTVVYSDTTTTAFDDYDYWHPSQPMPVHTNVPSGTLGRNWSFLKWSDGVTTQSRNVIVNNNINLQAQYKGSQVSSINTAYSNSSQRKIVRSTNGWNHTVYESMGHVWYEAKSASGNWGFIPGINGSLHLNFGAGKTPAIARTASTHPWGDMTLVAWQEANTIVMRIHYYSAASQSFVRAHPTLYTDIVMPSYYTLDVNPSIAWSDNGGFVLVYQSPTGIQYELYDFEVGNTPSLVSSGVVPGTDANSKNAAVSSFSYSVVDYTWFDIAWEQHGYSGAPNDYPVQSIRHSTLDYFEGESWVSSPQTISSSSVPKNSGISIISLASGPMIGWMSNATAGYTTSVATNKAAIRNPSTGVITTYDSYVRSVSVTADDNLSTYYLGWSQILDQNPVYDTNRFIAGTTPTQIKILNTKGWHLQLMNGPTASDMRASAFFPKTVPYYFQESNTLGSYLKEAPQQTTIARGVSVRTAESGASLSLDKLTVAGVPIRFTDVDQAQLRFTTGRSEQVRVSRQQMNERVLTHLVSEPFQLKSGDVVNFAEELSFSGTENNSSITVEIQPVGKAGASLPLRNVKTGAVTTSRQALAYRVQGISDGQYRLVIRVDSPEDAELLLLEHIRSGDVDPDAELHANEVIEIHSEQVTHAALHPNFPNPFNPSTVIRTQSSTAPSHAGRPADSRS